jgi:hypothetical protein
LGNAEIEEGIDDDRLLDLRLRPAASIKKREGLMRFVIAAVAIFSFPSIRYAQSTPGDEFVRRIQSDYRNAKNADEVKIDNGVLQGADFGTGH